MLDCDRTWEGYAYWKWLRKRGYQWPKCDAGMRLENPDTLMNTEGIGSWPLLHYQVSLASISAVPCVVTSLTRPP